MFESHIYHNLMIHVSCGTWMNVHNFVLWIRYIYSYIFYFSPILIKKMVENGVNELERTLGNLSYLIIPPLFVVHAFNAFVPFSY